MVGRHAGIDHPHGRQRHVRRIGLDHPRRRSRRLDRPLEHRHRAIRIADVAKILIHPSVQLGRIEIARDDHRRGGRTVIGLVECPRVLDLRRIQFLDRADHAATVDALVEAVVADHEALQPAVRRGVDTLAKLFLHNGPLGVEHGLVDYRPRHPLGMGPQHGLQILRRHRLIVVGEVLSGGGIARPAGVLNQGRDLAVRQVHRLAAQDVFEQVGEARAPLRIVLAANIVPEGHRHRARRSVRHGIDIKSVGQLAVGELQRRHRDRRRGLGKGRGAQGQQRGPQ